MTPAESFQRRYARQLCMPEIGPEGQEKLRRASVLIIGAGGLGSPAALYLAAAGVGCIGLADGDTVDLSNLQRQILHSTEKLGVSKAVSGAERLSALNPEIRVLSSEVFVREDNIDGLIAPYDFVLECTDSFEAKYLVNDACVRARKPFCWGAVLRFYGQMMTVLPGKSACYRCAFPQPPAAERAKDAARLGVVGPVPGVIGCLQAMETVKYFTGAGELLTDRMLTFDALETDFQTVGFARSSACPACGGL
ncbi:MAG: HesA/MoeB/ThiF family protein [Oscillospiraceae bacterium]|nr:HesA/MoeB/ThiF family protein [Oscillospiraceae bacterium]